jgi:hypothetical protein
MPMSVLRRVTATGTVLTVGAGLALLSPVPATGADEEWRVVASGLDSPRGLGFAPNGALYVAEAGVGGAGPCFPHPLGEECFGATGAVTQVRQGQQRRVLSGLPSFSLTGTGEVFGPSDVSFRGKGGMFVSIGLGNDPSFKELLPAEGQLAATVVRVKLAKGSVKLSADIGAFELSDNPDAGLPDSNPQSVLALPSTRIVADAGGNALLRAGRKGTVSTLAVFPNRLVPNPFGGPDIPMQAVPTSVARGPDGALYVGQLTGFPFPVGGANVYRVRPGEPPEVFAGGFTNIIDLAFAPDGTLYVLEIAHSGLLDPATTGALIRVEGDGTHTIIASDGLTFPTGLALRNGKAYVSNCGVCADIGEVVAIPLS